MSKNARPDAYHRRLQSNLRRNAEACAALAEWGFQQEDQLVLGLGVREPYVRTDGRTVSGVLAYPLHAASGRGRFGCVNIRGVTSNAEHEIAWSAGDPTTVRVGNGSSTLIVAGGPVSVWRLGLAVARAGADVAVIASSQPGRMPEEWSARRFWAPWIRLIILNEAGASVREAVATAANRPLEVVDLSGTETMPVERQDEWLSDILNGVGRVQETKRAGNDIVEDGEGDFAADPIPLHGGFARGQLLYPFRVERRCRTSGRMAYSYETLVLRGDGAIMEAGVLPAPPGTPPHRRVHALNDGTRITTAPEQSRTASWSLEGIRAYSAARRDGRNPCQRDSGVILSDVGRFIASRVSLPRNEDAWIAVGFVALTHMFRVFDALPIMLVTGEKGSGKSELASAVADLSFNSTVMAQGSAAALVRLASDCGGLVVLDDVEGLDTAGGAFGELAQCLKVGYKAHTAKKPLTAPSGRVDVHDFFGPRLITTTRGVDAVLASRCISVGTTPGTSQRLAGEIDGNALRDELHALAMSRVGDVRDAYLRFRERGGSRVDEITAPLFAISEALDCAPIREALTSKQR